MIVCSLWFDVKKANMWTCCQTGQTAAGILDHFPSQNKRHSLPSDDTWNVYSELALQIQFIVKYFPKLATVPQIH